MHVEDKLVQMGLALPSPGPPTGHYVGAVWLAICGLFWDIDHGVQITLI